MYCLLRKIVIFYKYRAHWLHSDEEAGPGEHQLSFMSLLRHILHGHRTVVISLEKFKVTDAKIGVMDRYSGLLIAIGLGPLCPHFVDVFWFGEGSLQSHIGVWKSMDHLCMYNDVSELALKTNGRVFSTVEV